jgi:predicted dithiol-disulfide oxidoreductase (DUF899 family)
MSAKTKSISKSKAPAKSKTKTKTKTPSHKVASRDEWLAARVELLKAEKEHTKRGDELARQRQALPWVRIEKSYEFDTDHGRKSFADLFQGRAQLIVYHFMFGPDYAAGCPACSSIADSFNGIATHLANHDVMFWAISRAPLAKLQPYKKRMGWSFPWASSHDTDFNADFNVHFTSQQQKKGTVDYNFRREPPAFLEKDDTVGFVAKMAGVNNATFTRDRPGMSAFIHENGAIYHTYSAYARGLDGLWNMYQWLDRAPKGRNEGDEFWIRRHDEYQGYAAPCCDPSERRP